MADSKIILDESPMSLRQLSKEIGCSYQKVLGLVRAGRKGVDGRTIKLRSVKVESGMATSLQEYKRFQLALNGVHLDGHQSAKLAG